MELFTLEGEFKQPLPCWFLWSCSRITCHCVLGQVCLAFGSLILFAGLIVVLVGYATPTRTEAFGEDDLLFVDR